MSKASTDPWRVFVNVAQIPENGAHRDIEADAPTRAAMADIAGLRDISMVRASFDLHHNSGGRVHVTGHVTARIGQTCVVSLEPVDNDINEDVDLIFAPVELIPEAAALVDDEDEIDDGDVEVTEKPEPIVGGVIDLGRLATDVLFLAIDPYPRKEGVVFEPPVTADDPKDHPFAALKALQSTPKKPKSGNGQDE